MKQDLKNLHLGKKDYWKKAKEGREEVILKFLFDKDSDEGYYSPVSWQEINLNGKFVEAIKRYIKTL